MNQKIYVCDRCGNVSAHGMLIECHTDGCDWRAETCVKFTCVIKTGISFGWHRATQHRKPRQRWRLWS